METKRDTQRESNRDGLREGKRHDEVQPGAIAWLHLSADNPEPGAATQQRSHTGPLGLQISPLRIARAPYLFEGARLRGTRCVWSASTVSGVELRRPSRPVAAGQQFDAGVHVFVRVEGHGSVFDPATTCGGSLRIYGAADEIAEHFATNTHLYTLDVPFAGSGIDIVALREMTTRSYELTPFQAQLLRGAVGLLVAGADELTSAASLIGVDRYLAALTGLLLRTAVHKPDGQMSQLERIRLRSDAIIYEQATDPDLTPALIAAQLNMSLRQLYRAFVGTESPAARIRRRRLERAAEILATRSGPGHVERVATECGFGSAEYFSRAFRREFGLSPRAYRSVRRDALARRERSESQS